MSMNQSFAKKREKENQQNFKNVISDLLIMLRASLRAETVSMHWVNNNRDVLVLENYATERKDVVFKDRVKREEHFLGNYSNIKSVSRLEVGTHIHAEEMSHYTSSPPVKDIYLIPFVFNAETIALTSVETRGLAELTQTDEDAVSAYLKALTRLLQTYLELSDLTEKQSEWTDYDRLSQKLVKSFYPLELVTNLIDELQSYVSGNGGALLLSRGLNDWHSVLYSANAKYPPPVGLSVQEGSIAAQALSGGEALFITHFNASPKRISVQEPLCKGATLAVPIMHRQRRQMLAMVYSENPLIFTEAMKHKVNNLCRICGLKIESLLPDLDVRENIFSTEVGSYSKEIFKAALSTIMKHSNSQTSSMITRVGMISIGNIVDLRTKYRLDDLRELQRQVLKKLQPQKFGFNGIIGDYSDYVYTFIMQSTDESAFNTWIDEVREVFKEAVAFSGENKELVQLNIGFARLEADMETDDILNRIKTAMNEAVKQNKFKKEV